MKPLLPALQLYQFDPSIEKPVRLRGPWPGPFAAACRAAAPALALLLAACGGGGGGVAGVDSANGLVAGNVSVAMQEDAELEATISGEGAASLLYSLARPPAHGTVAIQSSTGRFTYTPDPDFNGTDDFRYTVSADGRESEPATVSITVMAVDDPPQIAALPDVENSAYSYDLRIPLSVIDPDGDPLTITATADDTTVVEATVLDDGEAVLLLPLDHGSANVTIDVHDGNSQVSTSFSVTVQDVARRWELVSGAPRRNAVLITNNGDVDVDFDLTHNGRVAYSSLGQMVDAVVALPDEIPDELFERKLWRFVRDNTYHTYPINADVWLHAAAPTLNSFGWGFCSHVSATFVQIAAAAGYQTRIWALSGHVVPEILVDGQWRMYDPDLAVYYHARDGGVAGVEELMADTSLITAPIDRILLPSQDAAGVYSADLAAIYGSTGDNTTAGAVIGGEPFMSGRVIVPAGGRLIYPGVWTDNPVGYDSPDPTPHVIEQFRQARLEIAAGHLGRVVPPWVLWDVKGTGRVRIADQEFAAGSAELRDFLVRPGAPVTEVDIVANATGLALIMMINPLWYDMLVLNEIELTGKDVWALEADVVPLAPAHYPPEPVPPSLLKPRA